MQTVSQSVEDMFPRNLAKAFGRSAGASVDLDPSSSIRSGRERHPGIPAG